MAWEPRIDHLLADKVSNGSVNGNRSYGNYGTGNWAYGSNKMRDVPNVGKKYPF